MRRKVCKVDKIGLRLLTGHFFGVQKRCVVSKESSIFCFCGRKMELNEKVRLLGMGGWWIRLLFFCAKSNNMKVLSSFTSLFSCCIQVVSA